MSASLFLALLLSRAPLDRLHAIAPSVRWEGQALRADINCEGRRDQAYLGHGPGAIYVGILVAGGKRPRVLKFAVRLRRTARADGVIARIDE